MKTYKLADPLNIEERKRFQRPGDSHVLQSKPPHVRALAMIGKEYFRCPRKGEWYISGAEPEAYRAPNDLSSEYRIAELIEVRPNGTWVPNVEIEVCVRLADRGHRIVADEHGRAVREETPKYHAQIKDRPGYWGAGNSIDEAIGSLVQSHSAMFGVNVVHLEGKHAR